MAETATLKRHHLSHLPDLKVSDTIFESKFTNSCSMSNCNAACCKHGVYVDLKARDKILAHAAIIQKYLEPHQDSNPMNWFDNEQEVDLDFPSGRAVGTQTRDYGCVFLDKSGRCALQKAAMAEGMDKFALKPFHCVAYPVSIHEGTLLIDDEEFTERPECCSTIPDGALSIFDICTEELEFVLGAEGLTELKEIASKRL